MKLSPKFEEALVYATRLHGGQLRKKTNIPYIGHLLGVCAVAMEYGANETEAMPLFCTILWRIKFDPINELFLVAQPFSEGKLDNGSSIQVYDLAGNLVESIDGLNFQGGFDVFPIHITLNPSRRIGYVNGPDLTTAIQSFNY